MGSQTLHGLSSSRDHAEPLLLQTPGQEFSCSFFPSWSAIIFSLFFSPPTLLKYRVLQQQGKTCWIISLHFQNALELLGPVCDVGLFSVTWHCSGFYEPELESDIIINSSSFWFASILVLLLHSDSLRDIKFFFRNRKPFCARHFSFIAKAQMGFLVYVKGRFY